MFKQEEIERFIDENWISLRNLEYAYIASRFLPEEFRRDEAKHRDLLWSS